MMKLDAEVPEFFSCRDGFFNAFRRQIHIHPAREAILEIPLALAVSKNDQFSHRCRIIAEILTREKPSVIK